MNTLKLKIPSNLILLAAALTSSGQDKFIGRKLRTVVVDAAGCIQRIFTDNEWQPAELAAEMQRALEVKP